MSTQVETFGDALVLDTFKHPGGLNHAYASIMYAVGGGYYGSRNTFRKLLLVRSADDLNPIDEFRAWLLITAYGKNPEDYGISDTVVPLRMDVAELRKALCTPRDLNPEPTDYGFAGHATFKPAASRHDSTGPRRRAA